MLGSTNELNAYQLASLFWNKKHFILESRSKKTLKSSNPICQELKIGPKDFTLGFTFKKLIQVPKLCGALVSYVSREILESKYNPRDFWKNSSFKELILDA